jgi:hypothetical protein
MQRITSHASSMSILVMHLEEKSVIRAENMICSACKAGYESRRKLNGVQDNENEGKVLKATSV